MYFVCGCSTRHMLSDRLDDLSKQFAMTREVSTFQMSSKPISMNVVSKHSRLCAKNHTRMVLLNVLTAHSLRESSPCSLKCPSLPHTGCMPLTSLSTLSIACRLLHLPLALPIHTGRGVLRTSPTSVCLGRWPTSLCPRICATTCSLTPGKSFSLATLLK